MGTRSHGWDLSQPWVRYKDSRHKCKGLVGTWRNRYRQASRLATATSISAQIWDTGQEKEHLGARDLDGFNSHLCHYLSDTLGKSLLLFETQPFLP